MAGVVHVPWYATGLRGDKLAAALADISAIALRYGARSHAVYRYNDDRYKFMQLAEFESKDQWEAYWYGPEFTDMRIVCSSCASAASSPSRRSPSASASRRCRSRA